MYGKISRPSGAGLRTGVADPNSDKKFVTEQEESSGSHVVARRQRTEMVDDVVIVSGNDEPAGWRVGASDAGPPVFVVESDKETIVCGETLVPFLDGVEPPIYVDRLDNSHAAVRLRAGVLYEYVGFDTSRSFSVFLMDVLAHGAGSEELLDDRPVVASPRYRSHFNTCCGGVGMAVAALRTRSEIQGGRNATIVGSVGRLGAAITQAGRVNEFYLHKNHPVIMAVLDSLYTCTTAVSAVVLMFSADSLTEATAAATVIAGSKYLRPLVDYPWSEAAIIASLVGLWAVMHRDKKLVPQGGVEVQETLEKSGKWAKLASSDEMREHRSAFAAALAGFKTVASVIAGVLVVEKFVRLVMEVAKRVKEALDDRPPSLVLTEARQLVASRKERPMPMPVSMEFTMQSARLIAELREMDKNPEVLSLIAELSAMREREVSAIARGNTKTEPAFGVYLWGDAGVGKTLVTDLLLQASHEGLTGTTEVMGSAKKYVFPMQTVHKDDYNGGSYIVFDDAQPDLTDGETIAFLQNLHNGSFVQTKMAALDLKFCCYVKADVVMHVSNVVTYKGFEQLGEQVKQSLRRRFHVTIHATWAGENRELKGDFSHAKFVVSTPSDAERVMTLLEVARFVKAKAAEHAASVERIAQFGVHDGNMEAMLAKLVAQGGATSRPKLIDTAAFGARYRYQRASGRGIAMAYFNTFGDMFDDPDLVGDYMGMTETDHQLIDAALLSRVAGEEVDALFAHENFRDVNEMLYRIEESTLKGTYSTPMLEFVKKHEGVSYRAVRLVLLTLAGCGIAMAAVSLYKKMTGQEEALVPQAEAYHKPLKKQRVVTIGALPTSAIAGVGKSTLEKQSGASVLKSLVSIEPEGKPRFAVHGLCVSSTPTQTTFLTVAHATEGMLAAGSVKLRRQRGGQEIVYEIASSVLQIVLVPSKDLALVTIPRGSLCSVWEHFVDEAPVGGEATLHTSDDTYVASGCRRTDAVMSYNLTANLRHTPISPLTYATAGARIGSCGCPIMIDGCTVGIHVAGDERRRVGVAETVTKDQLRDWLLLSPTEELGAPMLDDVIAGCSLAEHVIGVCKYATATTATSKLVRTEFPPFSDKEYTKPAVLGYTERGDGTLKHPVLEAVCNMISSSQKPHTVPDVADAVSDAHVQFLRPFVRITRPRTLEEIFDDSEFVKSTSTGSTSAGVFKKHEVWDKSTKRLKFGLQEIFDRACESLERGEVPTLAVEDMVYRASMKDELRVPGKDARVMYASPLILLLLQKRYLYWLTPAVKSAPIDSMLGVGVNPPIAWQTLGKNFAEGGIDMDAANYDQNVKPWQQEYLCQVISALDVSVAARTLARMLRTFLVVVGTQVFRISGPQPSGSGDTSVRDGIMLLAALACAAVEAGVTDEHEVFNYLAQVLKVITYGDDVVAKGISPEMVALMNTYGLLITDGADKTKGPRFKGVSELSFLGRGFVKDGGAWRCPLRDRAYYMMPAYRYSDQSDEVYFSQMWRSLRMEAALRGKAEFANAKAWFNAVSTSLQIKVGVFGSYDDAIAEIYACGTLDGQAALEGLVAQSAVVRVSTPFGEARVKHAMFANMNISTVPPRAQGMSAIPGTVGVAGKDKLLWGDDEEAFIIPIPLQATSSTAIGAGVFTSVPVGPTCVPTTVLGSPANVNYNFTASQAVMASSATHYRGRCKLVLRACTVPGAIRGRYRFMFTPNGPLAVAGYYPLDANTSSLTGGLYLDIDTAEKTEWEMDIPWPTGKPMLSTAPLTSFDIGTVMPPAWAAGVSAVAIGSVSLLVLSPPNTSLGTTAIETFTLTQKWTEVEVAGSSPFWSVSNLNLVPQSGMVEDVPDVTQDYTEPDTEHYETTLGDEAFPAVTTGVAIGTATSGYWLDLVTPYMNSTRVANILTGSSFYRSDWDVTITVPSTSGQYSRMWFAFIPASKAGGWSASKIPSLSRCMGFERCKSYLVGSDRVFRIRLPFRCVEKYVPLAGAMGASTSPELVGVRATAEWSLVIWVVDGLLAINGTAIPVTAQVTVKPVNVSVPGTATATLVPHGGLGDVPSVVESVKAKAIMPPPRKLPTVRRTFNECFELAPMMTIARNSNVTSGVGATAVDLMLTTYRFLTRFSPWDPNLLATGEIINAIFLDSFTFRRGRPIVAVKVISGPTFFMRYFVSSTLYSYRLLPQEVTGMKLSAYVDSTGGLTSFNSGSTYGWLVLNANQYNDAFGSDLGTTVDIAGTEALADVLVVDVGEVYDVDWQWVPHTIMTSSYNVSYPVLQLDYHVDIGASRPVNASVGSVLTLVYNYPFLGFRCRWDGLELAERRPVVGLVMTTSAYSNMLNSLAQGVVHP